jgi:uncharacterized protein with PIN domain
VSEWLPDHLTRADDVRSLEHMRLDDAEARDQARRDHLTRDVGEGRRCGVCGRKYWSAGAHWEECTGRAA